MCSGYVASQCLLVYFSSFLFHPCFVIVFLGSQCILNLFVIKNLVFQGIILASKVNWRDDPKLRDIAMGLENMPN